MTIKRHPKKLRNYVDEYFHTMPNSSTQSIFTTYSEDRNNKITIIEGIQKSKR
jgi:hypothetical protein